MFPLLAPLVLGLVQAAVTGAAVEEYNGLVGGADVRVARRAARLPRSS